MKRSWTVEFLSLLVLCSLLRAAERDPILLDMDSQEELMLPALSNGRPAAGKRVKVTPREYSGTEVYHTVYLPENWKMGGDKLPVIFEYTGNHAPRLGSTGEVKDAGLGYGLSGGKYIWVSLPYINKNGKENQLTWWGDETATVEYAKVNVPRIIAEYGADSKAVFLCGFSRGAIGANYLGLHDDEVAKLWTAFITHDHFDGVKQWTKSGWGGPLEKYRKEAAERLRRVGGRPYLVCENNRNYGTKAFVASVLSSHENFTFLQVDTREIFGKFPNPIARHPHTDRWPLKPSRFRTATWNWMNRVVAGDPRDPGGIESN